MLLQWPQRVLLSPKAWKQWGAKEQRLGTRFPVLPASADSLFLMLQAWNEREELPAAWKQQVEDALERGIPTGREGISLLPQDMQAWVATCAIWPSLQWELSLYLGAQVGEWLDSDLLHTERLQELSRLPSFVEGKMEESLREELLDLLEKSILDLNSIFAIAYMSSLKQESWSPLLQIRQHLRTMPST